MRLPLVLLAFSALASQAVAADLSFVACPLYRDANLGRKSGCWLADDPATGARYDVTDAPAKPDWNYAVLVEGKIAAEPDGKCGGVRLNPVRTSVLTGERCTRHLLPSDGFPGRAFVLPARNVQPLTAERAAPKPPFPASRTFSLLFEYESDFFDYQLDDFLFDQAITYIRGVKPVRIVVTGYAATDPVMVSGRRLAEPAALAEARARKAAEALYRMGTPRETVSVKWLTGAKPAPVEGADGLEGPSRRRVDIEVVTAPR